MSTHRSSVTLTMEQGKSYENPDAGIIEMALRTLDGEDNTFAILASERETYLQTAGGPEIGFVLEYREGSDESHFQSAREDVTIDEVIRAFAAYAAGDDAWKAMFEWRPLVTTTTGLKGTRALLLLPFLAIFVAWIISKLISE